MIEAPQTLVVSGECRTETRGLPTTTEAECLAVQRISQDIFRERLIYYLKCCCPLTGITDMLRASHGIPSADCPQTLANTDGKNILTKHPRSMTNEFDVDYRQIAAAMQPDEIPDDPKTLLDQLVALCRT